MNKVWRLTFTILLMAVIAVTGIYAVGALLPFLGDVARKPWAPPLYYTIFIICFGVFGFAFGGWFFRRLEKQGENLKAMSPRDKFALVVGLIIGIILSSIVALPIIQLAHNQIPLAVGISLILGLIFTYFTTVAAYSLKEEIRFYMPPEPSKEEVLPPESFKLLDTNVIIDGRVADVARAGFLDGTLYVPGFVLDELQHIADSADGLKRQRGRRGLDILNEMQKELKLVVRIYDKLAPDFEAVDARLVRLAKAMNGSLITNDFNLSKVAELQEVPILNINALASALKPVVLPGEEFTVLIAKEGKEHSQGVAYLDDGTMIVVEGGRKHLGETATVVVSSVLQTQQGKMIFAHLADEEGEEDIERGVRPYTRSGTRRPIRR
jgi:uncharacterized protein YacL